MARTGQALRRVEAAARRTDTRGWVVQRRERTRHLIELGGLVQKAGLVELTDDDRATIYGAMLDLAARAQGDGNDLALWKRRGKRDFDAEAEGQRSEEHRSDIQSLMRNSYAVCWLKKNNHTQ